MGFFFLIELCINLLFISTLKKYQKSFADEACRRNLRKILPQGLGETRFIDNVRWRHYSRKENKNVKKSLDFSIKNENWFFTNSGQYFLQPEKLGLDLFYP